MTSINPRNFSLALLILCFISACSNGIGSNNTAQIDARVDATLNAMYETYPSTQHLAKKASGMLIMPLVTEGGFGIGAGFGRGALRVGDSNVDYYSAASASAGVGAARTRRRLGATSSAASGRPAGGPSAGASGGIRVMMMQCSLREAGPAGVHCSQPRAEQISLSLSLLPVITRH